MLRHTLSFQFYVSSQRIKGAPRDGIIIKNGSGEAKQMSERIKEHVKQQALSSTTTDNSSNGNQGDSMNVDVLMIAIRKRKRQLDLLCRDDNFGHSLSFAGRALLNIGHKLLQCARQPDAGVGSFFSSLLTQSSQICLP